MSFSPQPKLEAHIFDHIEMAGLSGMVAYTRSLTAWEADMEETVQSQPGLLHIHRKTGRGAKRSEVRIDLGKARGKMKS